MFKRKFLQLAVGSIIGAQIPLIKSGFAADVPKKKIKVGMLKYGTARWEMEIIKKMGLDLESGVDLELKEVSGKQASHVALMSREADIVLSDFLWVASLRSKGDNFTLVPHSYAVGGLISSAKSDIRKLSDLPGKTVGIAGGPLDKSWVVLRAYYKMKTGENLENLVEARFGSAPLINELVLENKVDASLNFWHFNARAKAAGLSEVISVQKMMQELGIKDTPPLLGWVFRDDIKKEKAEAIRGFLDASFKAKAILLKDDSAWDLLKKKMRADKNDQLFQQLRADYRKGIITEYNQKTVQAAADAFDIMAEVGGEKLVGANKSMDPKTFWSGYEK